MSDNVRRQSRWIRFENVAADEQVRLFCFPYAGGGASSFLPWKPLLPDYISLFPVQLPGHEERYGEQAVTDIDELCKRLAEALCPYFTSKTAFFGHSMGGLLAFRLALHLVREGMAAPVHLFISAGPTPLPPGELPPEGGGDGAFLNRVLQSNAVPESILLDADSLEVVKRTLLQDHALLLTMIDGTREALDIPISVFAGEKDILVPLDRVRLWRLFTTGVCSMATYPGGHFYLRKWRGEVIGQIAQSLLMYAL